MHKFLSIQNVRRVSAFYNLYLYSFTPNVGYPYCYNPFFENVMKTKLCISIIYTTKWFIITACLLNDTFSHFSMATAGNNSENKTKWNTTVHE